MAQKLEDASRFLDTDIARYRELNMGYTKNSNPSSSDDLVKLQELLLLEIRFLAGCDIRWDNRVPIQRTSNSSAVTTPEEQPPA